MVDLPKRKPNRLKGYEYNQNGAYFITICVQDRINLFGGIVGDGLTDLNIMQLSSQGELAQQYISELSVKYPNVTIEKYVIMPNHLHMILFMKNGTENPSPTVGTIIGWYKYQTTIQINNLSGNEIKKIWQRSFHDHIIRDEKDYLNIWEYVDTNPQRWTEDCFYADNFVLCPAESKVWTKNLL